MLVGFSKHGTGDGAGPVGYLMSKTRDGRKASPPVAVRGEPILTRQLIDSLDFKWKYTSGVLSFAPGEEIDVHMENTIINEFENLAFAGLEPDQYNILWVRHSHAGHHELHFVTPRIELETQKSLNIKPPGKRTQQAFDDFRSQINARYSLKDPDDPKLARFSRSPNYELRIQSQQSREGKQQNENTRHAITSALRSDVSAGKVKDREDILNAIKELGFDITRQGKNYITIQDRTTLKRMRLKGIFYEEHFNRGDYERMHEERTNDFARPNPEREQDYAKKISSHIENRATYHRSRYPKPPPLVIEPIAPTPPTLKEEPNNDRAGNPIVDRITAFGARIGQQTRDYAQHAQRFATKFRGHVYQHIGTHGDNHQRKRAFTRISDSLERERQRFERATQDFKERLNNLMNKQTPLKGKPSGRRR